MENIQIAKLGTKQSSGILLKLILYWSNEITPKGSIYKFIKVKEIIKKVFQFQKEIGYDIYRFYNESEKSLNSPSLVQDLNLLINQKNLKFKNPDPKIQITPTGYFNAKKIEFPKFIREKIE